MHGHSRKLFLRADFAGVTTPLPKRQLVMSRGLTRCYQFPLTRTQFEMPCEPSAGTLCRGCVRFCDGIAASLRSSQRPGAGMVWILGHAHGSSRLQPVPKTQRCYGWPSRENGARWTHPAFAARLKATGWLARLQRCTVANRKNGSGHRSLGGEVAGVLAVVYARISTNSRPVFGCRLRRCPPGNTRRSEDRS